MSQVGSWFVEGAITAAAGGFCIGIVYIIKLLIGVKRALDHIGPSLETLYTAQPFVLKALRHQNGALREIGANGSTVHADACIDEAEQIFASRHASLEGAYGRRSTDR